MTCLFDINQIQDYLDNRLSSEKRQQVEAHLETCPQCRREWMEMNNLMQLLGNLPMEELPEGFKEELHEKLVAAASEQPAPKSVLRPLKHVRTHIRAYSAAAAVLMISVVSVNMLGNLSLTKEASPEEVGYMMDAAQAPAPEPIYSGSADVKLGATENARGMAPMEAEAAAGTDGAVGFTAAQNGTGTVQDRKVIRSGSATLSTLAYDKTIEALTAYANQRGGYVESLYTGNQYTPVAEENPLKTGSITLRIPAAQFDGFFKELETYGRVSEKNQMAEDISMQYRDTYNQAVNLEVREAKLREIMGTAKTVQDVMAVEAELSRVRGEINQLKGTLQQWDALVNLSRITINITEVRSLVTQVTGLDTSLATRIREAFIASVNSIIAGTENLAVWAVSAVPWLFVGGLLMLGLWIPAKKAGWIRRKNT